MVFGGILAGGLGTRMSDSGLPKQFLKVGGVPVIIRTLRRFLSCEKLSYIVVAMNESWIDYCYSLMKENGIDLSRISIICGGETRFESLLCLANECKRIADEQKDTQVIMINHDCARPFVSKRILNDNLEMLKDFDMVTTSVPTIDTVLLSSDGKLSDCVPERSTVFLDQGPQTIDVTHFLSLVEGMSKDEREKYMEAGRLYIDKGLRVGIVKGERENFKLTTQFDLSLAEMLLKNNNDL